jgi:hypothetical protein
MNLGTQDSSLFFTLHRGLSLFLALAMTLLSSGKSWALTSELTLSYNYMRRTFDSLNWLANQSTTVGVAFYLGESFALELSYTDGLFVRKEKDSALNNSNAQRTSTQQTQSLDASVIWLLAGRRDAWQPFVRLGVSQIRRKQEVQIDNDIPFSVTPPDALAPSAGVGMRILLGERFSLRLAADTVQTPINENQVVYDLASRVGLSWIL